MILGTTWNLKTLCKWKKPDTKEYTLYDSTYMECPGQANLQQQKRLVVVRDWWGIKKSDC